MKCPTCESCEFAQYCGATEIMQKCERHNKKEVLTNEEYIRTCSTDELTTLLCALVDTGILNAWTIMYHCADSDSDAVRIWLQKTYEGNKE